MAVLLQLSELNILRKKKGLGFVVSAMYTFKSDRETKHLNQFNNCKLPVSTSSSLTVP